MVANRVPERDPVTGRIVRWVTQVVDVARAAISPPSEEDWRLVDQSPMARIVFRESLGTRFGGDPDGTAAYALNLWARTTDGLGWLALDLPVEPVVMGRAQPMLDLCYVPARMIILKRAVRDHEGQVEASVRQILKEALEMLGLQMGVTA